MKAVRTLLWIHGCTWAAAAGACMAAQAAATTRPATAATRPARVPLGSDMTERWRRYKLAWAGTNTDSQLLTDRRLVGGILQGASGEVAGLRDVMIGEYDRLAKSSPVDEYWCGRLASLIALAWTKVPTGKTLPPVPSARNTRLTCTEVCRWAERAIGHFAAGISDAHWKQHEPFLAGAAVSMMSLIPSRAMWIDRPGKMRDHLRRLRPRLEQLLAAAGDQAQRHKEEFEQFYKTIEPYGRLEEDKQAVLELLADFRDAWNNRDDAVFVNLWPATHKATRSLKNRKLASRIPPEQWKIAHWEPVYIGVKGDLALAYVVSRYRGKDGKLRALRLQRFPAKRHKTVGWKLN